MANGSRTYAGAVHVHSSLSGGEGSFQDLITAARDAELDFLVLTDHGTKGHGLEGLEGWHDGVLVLCGEEVDASEGQFLAFETRESIGKQETVRHALDEVRRQYGIAVSIHHQYGDCKSPSARRLAEPLNLKESDLVEIWSFTDEFLSRCTSQSILQNVDRPDRLIIGPSRRLLWKWDRELEKRMLPAVGGLNVHQRKAPLLQWKLLFPYKAAFDTITTYVIAGELPNVSQRARDLVWNALREGRSYIANRMVGDAEGFQFEYRPGYGRARQMGEDAPYERDGRFFICTPEEAEIVLRHNGQPLFWGTGREILFPTAGPGSYRVEVNLNRRCWILSNPIRIVDEEGVLQPTVSDVT